MDSFIATWNGKKADYDGMWGGECVDLYNFYMRDVFKLSPYAFGGVNGAKDLAVNLPKYADIEWIKNNPNDPNQVPKRGDIVVIGAPIGANYGHVGICTAATGTYLELFDQLGNLNDALEKPSAVRNQSWMWPYVLGWARLKQGDESMAIKNPEFIRNMYRYVGGREATQTDIDIHTNGTPESLLNGFISGGDLEVVRQRKVIADLQTALKNEQSKPPREVVKEVEKIVTEYVDRPVIVEKEVIKEVEPSWLVTVREAIKKFLRLG